jgi:hypothetical protein
VLRTTEPVLTISADDLEQAPALPLPTGRRAGPVLPSAAPAAGGVNRLAVASLVCAFLGIPFFGPLTGLVAIGLGSWALGTLAGTRQRGTGLAVAGVLLGLGDIVGWVVFLALVLGRPGQAVRIDRFTPDLAALEDLPPTLRRAMRANVLIECGGGGLGLGGVGVGSGVVLKRSDDEALILTNRHVIDPSYAGQAAEPGELPRGRLEVRLVDQTARAGHVTWLAPGGIDLALVRVALPSREVRAAKWRLGRPLKVGDPVFAIGNPHGLGWTHTQGAISQLRFQEAGGRRVRVIQTQTVVNPGNSGGGLYDQEGYLIGVIAWTQDKRVSEGLNFAITLDTLEKVPPPDLDVRAGSEGTD